MSTPASVEEYEDVQIVAVDLARSEPPSKRMLEMSAMDIASAESRPLGGVALQLDREPPEGWAECFQVAEGDLGYTGAFQAKVNGQMLELDYDPERFEERFAGLKLAITHANLAYRAILADRAEVRRRSEEAAESYRLKIAEAAQKLGIPTVPE